MDLQKVVNEAKDFRILIDELKKISPYYPNVIRMEADDKQVYFSTKVRKDFDGKWYYIHCVERIKPNRQYGEIDCLKYLMRRVYEIQYLYVLSGMEDVDELQISEIERISEGLH